MTNERILPVESLWSNGLFDASYETSLK